MLDIPVYGHYLVRWADPVLVRSLGRVTGLRTFGSGQVFVSVMFDVIFTAQYYSTSYGPYICLKLSVCPSVTS